MGMAWGLRIYLLKKDQRIVFSKYLLAGTIPVLLSCVLQLWFGFDRGPYTTLNNLIIWFQYPIKEVGGLTGLFNNQNVLGMWLSVSLALSLGLIKEEKNAISKLSLLSFVILIIYFIFLTNSRNAFLALLITIFISRGIKKGFYILISSISFLFVTNILYPFENNNNLVYIPIKLLEKLQLSYSFFEDRIYIWNEALKLILQRPFLGWGGSTFPYLVQKEGIGFVANHTHNLQLELAFSFGIPASLIFTFFIIKLARKSFNNIFIDKKDGASNMINKSWFLCFVLILVSHITDMTFFDGRISIILAIIISGLINIVNEPNQLIAKKNKAI